MNMQRHITPRSLTVLRLRWQGKCVKQIAEEMNVGRRTVDYHWRVICTVLGVQDQIAVIRTALQQGLISLSD